MTLMERLADFISGGALTRARDGRDFVCEKRARLIGRVFVLEEERDNLRATLRTIAAMETPGANATVRRMAKVAREALR